MKKSSVQRTMVVTLIMGLSFIFAEIGKTQTGGTVRPPKNINKEGIKPPKITMPKKNATPSGGEWKDEGLYDPESVYQRRKKQEEMDKELREGESDGEYIPGRLGERVEQRKRDLVGGVGCPQPYYEVVLDHQGCEELLKKDPTVPDQPSGEDVVWACRLKRESFQDRCPSPSVSKRCNSVEYSCTQPDVVGGGAKNGGIALGSPNEARFDRNVRYCPGESHQVIHQDGGLLYCTDKGKLFDAHLFNNGKVPQGFCGEGNHYLGRGGMENGCSVICCRTRVY